LAVSEQKVFYLRRDSKNAIAYDTFFLIFGNSELRLKHGELKVFSNFAVNKGWFDPRF
jgi:hypothetical protein